MRGVKRTPCVSQDWAAAHFEGVLQGLSQAVQALGSLTLAVDFGNKLQQ